MASLSGFYGGVRGAAEDVKRDAIAAVYGVPPNQVQSWVSGASVTSPFEYRIWEDDLVYFAPDASPTNRITMPVTGPTNLNGWVMKNADSVEPGDYGSIDDAIVRTIDDGDIL